MTPFIPRGPGSPCKGRAGRGQRGHPWGSQRWRGLPWPHLGTSIALPSPGAGAAAVPLLALREDGMAQAPVGRCPQSLGQMDGPPCPRALPALPALPAALSGTRSAEGSAISGHIPSMGTRGTGSPSADHGAPPARGTYRVSGWSRGSHWPRGTVLAGVSLEIVGVEREAELLAVLPAHLIPKKGPANRLLHRRARSRPLPALTWGPPSPLHPGVPGSGLLLPGGPWGAERGLSETPRHSVEPWGCKPVLTTSPRGPGGPFCPRAPREPFCP